MINKMMILLLIIVVIVIITILILLRTAGAGEDRGGDEAWDRPRASKRVRACLPCAALCCPTYSIVSYRIVYYIIVYVYVYASHMLGSRCLVLAQLLAVALQSLVLPAAGGRRRGRRSGTPPHTRTP